MINDKRVFVYVVFCEALMKRERERERERIVEVHSGERETQ